MIETRRVEQVVRRLRARALLLESRPTLKARHWRAATFRQAAAMVAELLPPSHPMRKYPREGRLHG